MHCQLPNTKASQCAAFSSSQVARGHVDVWLLGTTCAQASLCGCTRPEKVNRFMFTCSCVCDALLPPGKRCTMVQPIHPDDTSCGCCPWCTILPKIIAVLLCGLYLCIFDLSRIPWFQCCLVCSRYSGAANLLLVVNRRIIVCLSCLF